jgi:hypothetical protein
MQGKLLAIALVVASASPVLAQNQFGKNPTVRRTTHVKSEGTPTKYVATRHATGTVSDGGCTSCASGGCDSGCSSCSSGCALPPLLPNLMDNCVDLFVRFKPCPSRCGPCARTVHCCPYPKTMPPTNCCHRRFPGLLDSIFACKGHCGKRGCSSCTSGCATGSTSGCGCQAHPGTPYNSHDELIAPPAPMPEMKETPFKDDPDMPREEARRKPTTKTASTPSNWYKAASRPAPVHYQGERTPETFVAGNAAPIYSR